MKIWAPTSHENVDQESIDETNTWDLGPTLRRALYVQGPKMWIDLTRVSFIDSSGLGMLVRLLISMRKNGGDLKLCNVPPDIHKVLKTTNLNKLFDMHESEEDAILSFYSRNTTSEPTACEGPRLLCVDPSADVLAYLRELLRRAGYNVLTNSNLHDSLILIRATQPGLVIVGPNLISSPGTQKAFRDACAQLSVLELGDEFATLDAGQAGSELPKKIQERLH